MEHLRITVAGKVYDVHVEKIEAADQPAPAAPARVAPAAPASVPPVSHPWQAPHPPKAATGAGDATSPLAGIVQAIDRKVGDTVSEGDPVLTLEAMKMYTAINAPTSGTIKEIYVKVGEAVEEGQLLYTIG